MNILFSVKKVQYNTQFVLNEKRARSRSSADESMEINICKTEAQKNSEDS